ncbi:MAG: DUF4838 domain-containing protein [Lentisphaeria bacterium]|nr:DUF4838 domain-containing protein [Lentisphaeria bacterium]
MDGALHFKFGKTAVIVCGSIMLLAGSAYAFDLVKDGETAEIVLPVNAYPSTKLAAEELSEYAGKVTGKKLPVVTGKSSAVNRIYIGTPDTLKNLPESAVKALGSAKQNEAHFIYAKGNTLHIIGKQEVADLYATYQFIEDKLGVRWLKPADKIDSGEYVPKKEQITFPDYEKFSEPVFRVRRIDQGAGSNWKVIPVNGKTWATRNGYQTPPAYGIPIGEPGTFRYKFYSERIPRSEDRIGGGSHRTFSAPMPAKTTFERHPEYFALVDGKRVKGEQYCISNPEVRRNVAAYIIKRLDKTQGKGTFNFGMVDISHGWCECEECRKLDDSKKTTGNKANVSARFFKTVRAIAEMVYEKYPDADLSCWAYWTYRELPEGVTLHPKMKLYFCSHGRCYGHTLDDPNCPRNVRIYKLLLRWLKESPKEVFTYEYFRSSKAYYVCNEEVQAHDLRLYQKLGLSGAKVEGCFPDSKFNKGPETNRPEWMPSNWQWAYVTAKLLWDPARDEQKLLAEAESLYYGKAYPAMKKYHDLRRKLWNGISQCMGFPHGDPRTPYALNPPGSAEQLIRFLHEADKLAEGDKVLQYRLANDRRWLKTYWIEPNRKLKETALKTMRAPDAQSKIVIDGSGDERAWAGAYYLTTGLKQMTTKKDLPEELRTTLGILSDENNLYFLITAMEPSPGKMKGDGQPDRGNVCRDDHIELFLRPPMENNSYYHLAINSKGTVFDALGVNPASEFNIPVEVKTKIHPDRYVIEARVPLEKLKKPERGEIWHLNFARGRRIDDALTPASIGKSGSFSLDGCRYHDVSAFRPLEIGTPYVKNGSFDDLDQNGKPKFWVMTKDSAVEKSGSGHAVRINGEVSQNLTVGELKQQPFERKITYSFKASGKGKLAVRFLRYTDTPDPKAKKPRRKFHKPFSTAATYEVTEQPKIHHGKYVIAPNEAVVFELRGKGILVDEVSIRLEK